MRGKVHGAVIRERGARLRAIGAELSRRFRESQVGTVRPGLTLEDGTLVVTDNYPEGEDSRRAGAQPARAGPGGRRDAGTIVGAVSAGA